MTLENIFFDFDGVLAESVSAKTEAFREMYLPYGEEIAVKVVDYHINNGGVSRFEKFRVWEKEFFGKNLTDEQIKDLATKFSDLVLNKVIHAEKVPYSVEFLEKYSSKMRFWIITGTPSPEIEIIVKERNLDHYFEGVHGSPQNKRYWSNYLLDTFDLDPQKTLFIGDATTDLDAAQFSNLHFALRDNDENKNLFLDYEGTRFKDFKELETILLRQNLL
jgi:phosphoglycolate phosphatase-like HAD superfamily hydrolase